MESKRLHAMADRSACVDPGPDFIIIGAMKCGTSTLHEQLSRQPGVFMTTPKEPNFFSDKSQLARGLPWYRSLFEGAAARQLRGEASTHYTKLPTYPHTVERLHDSFPDLRLVYVIRHPVDRLISHFIHEWTERRMDGPVEQALARHPELVAYSEYGRQLAPYRDAFGDERLQVVCFEQMVRTPQASLARIARHIGLPEDVVWHEEWSRANVSAERLRAAPLRDALVAQPVLSMLRRALVPKAVRSWIKGFWQMRERPAIDAALQAQLEEAFDRDLALLDDLLDTPMRCADFRALAVREETTVGA